MYRRVDPAALLFSIFTVAFSPLTTSGPWDLLNTVIAFVVGIVVIAFTWPREEVLKDESGEVSTRVDLWIVFAQAIAYGLIAAIGIAWFIQLIWLNYFTPSVSCQLDSYGGYSNACLQTAEHVSYVAVAAGFIAAIVLFFAMRRRIATITRSFM